jgi:hypothetical protein
MSCLWVQGPTKQGIIFWGRQVAGATWYHFWDTYAGFGRVDRTQAVYSSDSFGYHAERWRSIMYVYDPAMLAEAAAGKRPPTGANINYVDGGDWSATFPRIPRYRSSTVYSDASKYHHDPAGGGSQLACFDSQTGEIFIMMPDIYEPAQFARYPLIVALGTR